MKTSTYHNHSIILIFLVALSSFGCMTQKKLMDANATERLLDIKAETFFLLDKHKEDYSVYADKVDALRIKCIEGYEYEKLRGKSATALKMWEVMMDKEKPLLGGFLDRWENNRPALTDAFTSTSKFEIREGLDILTYLMYRRVEGEDVPRAKRFLEKYK